jgi:hypothetical protein
MQEKQVVEPNKIQPLYRIDTAPSPGIINSSEGKSSEGARLARFSHQVSTAAAGPGMSTALRSVRLLDVLSSTPAEPSVERLVSMLVCAASLQYLVRKAGRACKNHQRRELLLATRHSSLSCLRS